MKNWKTTIIGAAVAGLAAAFPKLTDIIVAVGVALLGVFSADAKKSSK